MPEAVAPPGRIGPNALLQLAPVLDRVAGEAARIRLFADAGLEGLPDPADGLIDERPVARVHQALRRARPGDAAALAAEAGARTADYVIAHRIPRPVVRLLRALPAPFAAPLLARAIAKHAWTFAGSGRFSVARGPVFLIADNPVVRGEVSDVPLCAWHAAVFERLFRVLVDERLRGVETACCATGAPACRFALRRA